MKRTTETEQEYRRLLNLRRSLHARHAAADRLTSARRHVEKAEASFRAAVNELLAGRRIAALVDVKDTELKAALLVVNQARREFRSTTVNLLRALARLRKALPNERRLTQMFTQCLSDLRSEGQHE